MRCFYISLEHRLQLGEGTWKYIQSSGFPNSWKEMPRLWESNLGHQLEGKIGTPMTRKRMKKRERNHEMLRTASRRLVQVAGLALVMLAVFVSAQAQVTTGKVRGIVQDPTGAVVPGAKVTIENKKTNATSTCSHDGVRGIPIQ